MTESGVIIKGLGGLYTVVCGGRLYSCPARGIFRKDNFKPMIGDKVELSELREEDDGGLTGVIQTILPRTNSLVRPAVANVDQIIVVMAAKSPAPDLLLVDRLILSAERKKVPVVIVINKTDQDPELAEEWKAQYENAVSGVLLTKAGLGEGREQLLPLMEGKISVMRICPTWRT